MLLVLAKWHSTTKCTAIAKQLINAAEGEGDEAATLEGLAGALAAFTEDGAEGVASFRGKRAPGYTGR